MLQLNVITLFPDLFTTNLKNRPFNKAIEKNYIKVELVNLRNFALDSYGTVDDKPYGGGVGMVLRPEPISKALESIGIQTVEKTQTNNEHASVFTRSGDELVNNDVSSQKISPAKRIIVLSPSGKKWTQQMAQELSSTAQEITFICGRYEGIDQRITDLYATDVISIGDYVLSGGELPTLVIMESITRLIPGVLEKEEATRIESFTTNTTEYPQYTRPEEFMGKKVPDVLLSGNHKEIEKWKAENSKLVK